jgi:hypothetical protein
LGQFLCCAVRFLCNQSAQSRQFFVADPRRIASASRQWLEVASSSVSIYDTIHGGTSDLKIGRHDVVRLAMTENSVNDSCPEII